MLILAFILLAEVSLVNRFAKAGIYLASSQLIKDHRTRFLGLLEPPLFGGGQRRRMRMFSLFGSFYVRVSEFAEFAVLAVFFELAAGLFLWLLMLFLA